MSINKWREVFNLSVYDNVKKLCERKGISIAKLERDCDLGNGSVGKWKEGPGIKKAKRIADYLGVKMEDLLKD